MTWVVHEYGMPLVAAIALHGLALLALHGGWNPSLGEVRLIKPQIIHSTLLVLEAEVKPKQSPKPVAETRTRAAKKPKPKPVADPEPAVVETQPDLQAQRRLEEARRQQRLDALANIAFLDAVASEATNLAEQNAAGEAEAVAQSYRYRIYRQVVANWSRPASARNGMQAKLLVELVPTGDVVSVALVEGSGNGAFDRSAEAAINKSRRFEVPDESKIFEKHFRRFALLFRPEDLLR